MYGSSTLMLCRIDNSLYLPPTGHMKGLRFVPTSTVVMRWNMAPSPPFVMSLTGGAGPAATTCFKRLASLLSEKWDQSYSSTLAWLRCTLSFAILRSSIQCIQGARSAAGCPSGNVVLPVDLILSEAGFDNLQIFGFVFLLFSYCCL